MSEDNNGGPSNDATLLDWFAGQAMVSVACPILAGVEKSEPGAITLIAETAYKMAEAMLAEKKRRESL